MFKMTILTGGAAFRGLFDGERDDSARAEEVARILAKVRKDVLEGSEKGSVMDTNGNKVCEWGLS